MPLLLKLINRFHIISTKEGQCYKNILENEIVKYYHLKLHEKMLSPKNKLNESYTRPLSRQPQNTNKRNKIKSKKGEIYHIHELEDSLL
jgi:hypothetical protein